MNEKNHIRQNLRLGLFLFGIFIVLLIIAIIIALVKN